MIQLMDLAEMIQFTDMEGTTLLLEGPVMIGYMGMNMEMQEKTS